MHGGLSEEMHNRDFSWVEMAINSTVRPAEIPNSGLICDLLWADPDTRLSTTVAANSPSFAKNDIRGVSVVFNSAAVRAFLNLNDFDLIVRAHECVEDGYLFFADRGLVTVFSAIDFCGESNNSGAVLNIDNNMVCTFLVLAPTPSVKLS